MRATFRRSLAADALRPEVVPAWSVRGISMPAVNAAADWRMKFLLEVIGVMGCRLWVMGYDSGQLPSVINHQPSNRKESHNNHLLRDSLFLAVFSGGAWRIRTAVDGFADR